MIPWSHYTQRIWTFTGYAQNQSSAGCVHSALRRASAFSLIEVVIAIGVVAMAFIPLMGMLPTGMSSFRQSADRSAFSQIFQRIASDLQQSDFEAIVADSPSTQIRYFNEQSAEVAPENRTQAIFQARVTVLEEPASPHLKRLILQVARNPGGANTLAETSMNDGTTSYRLWSDSNPLPISTRSLILARNSKAP